MIIVVIDEKGKEYETKLAVGLLGLFSVLKLLFKLCVSYKAGYILNSYSAILAALYIYTLRRMYHLGELDWLILAKTKIALCPIIALIMPEISN